MSIVIDEIISMAVARIDASDTSCRDDLRRHVAHTRKLLHVLDNLCVRWVLFGSFVEFARGTQAGFADVDIVLFDRCDVSGIMKSIGGSGGPSIFRVDGCYFDVSMMYNFNFSYFERMNNVQVFTCDAGFIPNKNIVVGDGRIEMNRSQFLSPLNSIHFIRYAASLGMDPAGDPFRGLDAKRAAKVSFLLFAHKVVASPNTKKIMGLMDLLDGWRFVSGHEAFVFGLNRYRLENASSAMVKCHHGTVWRYVLGDMDISSLVAIGLPARGADMIITNTRCSRIEYGTFDECASQRIAHAQMRSTVREVSGERFRSHY